jgi:hypothetical protein
MQHHMNIMQYHMNIMQYLINFIPILPQYYINIHKVLNNVLSMMEILLPRHHTLYIEMITKKSKVQTKHLLYTHDIYIITK